MAIDIEVPDNEIIDRILDKEETLATTLEQYYNYMISDAQMIAYLWKTFYHHKEALEHETKVRGM